MKAWISSKNINGILNVMQDNPYPETPVPAAPIAVAPQPAVIQPVQGRPFLVVFFFSFVWGVFGVDRFYLGKIWTGILKFLTFGGFGIWAMLDLSQIMSGVMRDKQGNEMVDYARYKKLASKIVKVFALIVGVTIVLVGAAIFYAIYNIVTQLMQNGGLNNLIPGGLGMPNINQLLGL